MGGRSGRNIPMPLVRARGRFEQWRRRRRRGTRIPDGLWNLAVKLAEAHGVHRTASVLRLDYASLKRRAVGIRTEQTITKFVELSPPLSAKECVIEFEDRTGARMRVHLKGHQMPDLIALSRSFWEEA